MSSVDTQILQSQNGAQKRTCPLCNVEYSSVSAKNKHMKNIHNQQLDTNVKKTQHIICPLCTENKLICGTYGKLEQHLEENHNIKLEIETRNFATKESYELWFEKQQTETTYASVRLNKYNDYIEKTYTCNRTNSTGHRSNCSKRIGKAGGSIKIYGVCPSRLNIKIWKSGETNVKFCKTHLGHEEEIRSQHLSKLEKTEIVKKLCMGVTVDKIISDARKVTSDKIQRINKLNRNDVSYLMKKHNMERPHSNTYQDRVVIKAHECAETMRKNNIEILEVGFGKFKVKSTEGDHFYKVAYNELCETECKTSYCKMCKICIHRYKCECPEYALRTTICKHIHLVCLNEHRPGSDSVLEDMAELVSENKLSDIKEEHKEEIENFVTEKRAEGSELSMVHGNINKEAEINYVSNFLRSLNDEDYKKYMGQIRVILRQANGQRCIKMEKQESFPNKRRKLV